MRVCLKYNLLKILQNTNVLHALQAQIMLDKLNNVTGVLG